MHFLDVQLNEAQAAAAFHREGPLLVLAGPGSGKTRVVTSRIAFLVHQGVPASQLLALTFTNKAAAEMAARVAQMCGAPVWVSTFHRFCSRLLRQYARFVGLDEFFTIYDAEDSSGLVKQMIDAGAVNTGRYTAGQLAQTISRAKNELLCPDDLARSRRPLDLITAELLPVYQQRLLAMNAVDFDDLLLHVGRLLQDNSELRRQLDERYQFVLVDEYQDTNLAQYAIVRGLSLDYPNLTVTGDPDQSIYSWRGATINNILSFERDFPNATVVRLEQNYRSTKCILEVADRLIEANQRRKAKSLWTANESGPPVKLLQYDCAPAEASGIVDEIALAIDAGRATPGDFAVLYRTNALSRLLEHAFRSRGIPYQVVRGIEFYKRKEIKDILSYLQLILNPSDDLALLRVINAPPRGLGKVTLQRLRSFAEQQRLSLRDALRDARFLAGLAPKFRKALHEVNCELDELNRLSTGRVATAVRRILDVTGYAAHLRDSVSEDDQQRLANVEELCTAAREFDQTHEPRAGLAAFLEQAALVNDTDDWEPSADRVTLLTLHAAKGLEFRHVFIMALEDGILPHERSRESAEALEEERRLLFVGVTRAKERLLLSYCRRREYRGRSGSCIPSMFLMELRRANLEFQRQESPTWPVPNDAAEYPAHRPLHPAPPGDSRTRETASLRSPAPLMTAAEMLAGGGNLSPVPTTDLQLGCLVLHPEFGPGRVVDVQGSGKSQTVAVKFMPADTTRKFRAAFSPLRAIKPDVS
jgi:DNA helicase-2/ATP-dependent DNA helicase PcrA